MTTNGKHLPPQAIQWHSEFGPPVRRKVSRASAPRDGGDMTWGDRLAVLLAAVICSAAAAFIVVVIGALLYLGAQLMKGLLHA